LPHDANRPRPSKRAHAASNCWLFKQLTGPHRAGRMAAGQEDMREKENIMSDFERLIPVLTYQDIPAAHDFLVSAFGFNGGGVHRDAEGQPVHGEVRAGDATIWLHRITPEHRLNSPLAADVAN